ncbi:11398_t:CDS:2, partial [Funneliformis mosseae]
KNIIATTSHHNSKKNPPSSGNNPLINFASAKAKTLTSSTILYSQTAYDKVLKVKKAALKLKKAAFKAKETALYIESAIIEYIKDELIGKKLKEFIEKPADNNEKKSENIDNNIQVSDSNDEL